MSKIDSCQFHLSLSERLYDSFKHDGFYLQDGKSRLLCSIISIRKVQKKISSTRVKLSPELSESQKFPIKHQNGAFENTDKKDIELIDISEMSSQIIAKEFLLETKSRR